jgi:IstB-like ATP binding protein
MTAVAMIDRLVHHAEILSLKGDSYRLRDKDLGARPGAQPAEIAYRSPTQTPPSPAERSHAPVPTRQPINQPPNARSTR